MSSIVINRGDEQPSSFIERVTRLLGVYKYSVYLDAFNSNYIRLDFPDFILDDLTNKLLKIPHIKTYHHYTSWVESESMYNCYINSDSNPSSFIEECLSSYLDDKDPVIQDLLGYTKIRFDMYAKFIETHINDIRVVECISLFNYIATANGLYYYYSYRYDFFCKYEKISCTEMQLSSKIKTISYNEFFNIITSRINYLLESNLPQPKVAAYLILCLYEDALAYVNTEKPLCYIYDFAEESWCMLDYARLRLFIETTVINTMIYHMYSIKQSLQTEIAKYINKLKHNKIFQREVCDALSVAAADNNFQNKLNSQNILKFKDLVYDLNSKSVRRSDIHDLCTMSFSCNYNIRTMEKINSYVFELSPVFTHDIIQTLKYLICDYPQLEHSILDFQRYISDIFPEVEERNYILIVLSSYLERINALKMISIWLGGTNNGKSSFANLLIYMFGDYARNVNSSLILSNRISADGPSPTMADLDKVNLIVIAEPDSKKIVNADMLKILSGNDSNIVARKLYENNSPKDIRPNVIIQTNNTLCIPNLDKSLVRRITVIPFRTEFVTPSRDMGFVTQNSRYKRVANNKYMSTEFKKSVAPLLLKLLIKIHQNVDATSYDKPESIVIFSREYLNLSSDIYNFINLFIKPSHYQMYIPVAHLYDRFINWARDATVKKGKDFSESTFVNYLKGFDLSIVNSNVMGVEYINAF